MSEYRSIWKHLFRTPHKLDWVDVEGVRTRYLEAGPADAPTVILLHGSSGSLEYFCANIAEYAEHFHVLAVDMMGSGWTDRPDYPYTPDVYREHVRGFMDAMGVQRASLVGVALGSAIAVHVAHTYPQRVDKVVMVSPGAIISDPEDMAQFVSGIKDRRKAAVDELSWDNVHKIFAKLMLKEESVMDDLVAVRLAIYSEGDIERHMRNMMSSAGPQLCLEHNQWRQLQTPLLVFAAVDSPNMFLRNARLIGQLAPHATVVDVSGCRIWAHYEQAQRFHETSIPFLRGQVPT
jgi:2-hydroxy-6-oxonona-2,4-dienedioate hydrolase